MIPTLFGIMVINFVVVQAAPGGPVEQMIAEFKGKRRRRTGADHGRRAAAEAPAPTSAGRLSRRARPRPRMSSREIKKMFGFDKPPLERFWT